MAKIISEIGFDAVDPTVRPGGHVEPEHVERDLPKVAEAYDKQGIKLGMMTTAIKSVDDTKTEPTLNPDSVIELCYESLKCNLPAAGG